MSKRVEGPSSGTDAQGPPKRQAAHASKCMTDLPEDLLRAVLGFLEDEPLDKLYELRKVCKLWWHVVTTLRLWSAVRDIHGRRLCWGGHRPKMQITTGDLTTVMPFPIKNTVTKKLLIVCVHCCPMKCSQCGLGFIRPNDVFLNMSVCKHPVCVLCLEVTLAKEKLKGTTSRIVGVCSNCTHCKRCKGVVPLTWTYVCAKDTRFAHRVCHHCGHNLRCDDCAVVARRGKFCSFGCYHKHECKCKYDSCQNLVCPRNHAAPLCFTCNEHHCLVATIVARRTAETVVAIDKK